MKIPYISEGLGMQCSGYRSLKSKDNKPDLSWILTHSVDHPTLFGATNLRERGQRSKTQNIYLPSLMSATFCSGKTPQR